MISLSSFFFQSPRQALSLSLLKGGSEKKEKKMRMRNDLREEASTVPREALCLLSVPNEWRRLRRVGSISKVFILPETLRD